MDLSLKSTRDAFGDALLEAAGTNEKIVALTADLADSLRVKKFGQVFPDRFFDVGVAEQNMMGIAAGLALEGFIPFVTSFAVFSPGRNWDQLRVSVCYNNANVKIIGGYVGFSNGKDGATHQALEDIALTRVLPNLTVIDTADYDETYAAMQAVIEHVGPVYWRIRRDPVERIQQQLRVTNDELKKFEIGKGRVLVIGKDVTIIACGQMVHLALKAAHELQKEKINAKVINLSTIKPIDRDLILKSAQETKCIVTVEEHQAACGMGSAVAEVVIQDYPVLMKIIGVDNQFGETGTQDELLKSKGLTVENIIYNVKEVMKMKK